MDTIIKDRSKNEEYNTDKSTEMNCVHNIRKHHSPRLQVSTEIILNVFHCPKMHIVSNTTYLPLICREKENDASITYKTQHI